MKYKKSNLNIFLEKNGATILTCMGIAGVVATTVVTAKTTTKADVILQKAEEEKGDVLTVLEKVDVALPVYLPTILLCSGTILCIAGSNILNKKKQEALVRVYSLMSGAYQNYRNTLIELHGEELDKEIGDAVVRKYCNYHQIDSNIPDKKLLFYEPFSGQTFYRYEKEILDVEYHLNRNFVLKGQIMLNDYYDMLGLPKTDEGEEVGWSISDGYYWIDFEHRLVERGDGKTYYSIDILFPPDAIEDIYKMMW